MQEKKLEDMSLEELKGRINPKILPELEKKAQQSWLDAKLSQNDVFINFCNNEKICSALVHILLQSFNIKMPDPTIVYEKSANIGFDSKEVRFDMYIEDDNIIIDMEMQVVIKLMSRERIRTYQAVIDIEQMKKAGSYSDLKDTFIIIICIEDPFKQNQPVYRIKKTPEILDLEDFKEGEFDISKYLDDGFDTSKFKELEDYKFDTNDLNNTNTNTTDEYIDGANIIFFNASAFNKVKNKELRTFLAYVMGKHIKDCGFYHLIDQRFNKIKINKEVEMNYMMSYFREQDRMVQLRELVIEEVTRELKEEVTREVTEEVTRELKEEVTREVTEEVTREVTEEVTREVTEEVTREVTEEFIINMLSDFTDEQIAKVSKLTVDEIKLIRKENT